MEHTHYFHYNGRDSTDYGIRIYNNVHLPMPEKDIELVSVPGVNGSLSIDRGGYKDIQFDMPCEIKTDGYMKLEELSRYLFGWLSTGKWGDLYFSGHPDYYYTALVHSAYEIEDFSRHLGKVTIPFQIKPTKRSFRGNIAVKIKNGDTLVNPECLPSYPLIIITGTGTITVKIGSQTLSMQGIEKGITIDTHLNQAYHGDKNLSHQVTSYPFPTLSPGENKITWSGSVDSLYIAPRWEALA